MFCAMQQGQLFLIGYVPLRDDEVEAALVRAVAAGGRLPRAAEACLLELTAAHLLNELRLSGFELVRPAGFVEHPASTPRVER